MKIDVNQATIDDIAQAQAQYNAAAQAVGAQTGGLQAVLAEGLAQLDRFVAGNIEVDTGRTKNSIFQHLGGGGNRVEAMLATSVYYAPYVRDAGHGEPFFDYAARVEGPSVAERLGLEVISRVEEAFDG